MISKQQGSYLILLTELQHHGLPELQRLKSKLERGFSLNDSELQHVGRFIEQAQQLTSLEQQIPHDNKYAAARMCQLIHEVSQQALENVQKKLHD